MRVEHTSDLPPGAMRVQLGPVERWVVTVCAAAVVAICGGFASMTMQRLDRMTDQQARLSEQQAVTISQLTEVSRQLADVPGLKDRVTALEVQVKTNTQALEKRP